MEAVQLTETAVLLRGGSNAGLIIGPQGNEAVLVDTGLDGDTAKKILRIVERLGLRLTGVTITHAHADHFGGAALIRARSGVPIYAPALEAAVIENPLLEPLYLFSGASPIVELTHKFTLAEACTVDAILREGTMEIGGVTIHAIAAPGHAPNQMMVAGGGACYMADACFAPSILDKHGIPFYVDVVQAAETLQMLQKFDGRYDFFVPGHREPVEAIGSWAELNLRRIAEIRNAVSAALECSARADDILIGAADRLGVTIPNPVIHCLMQTTVYSCLSALQAEGRASVAVDANRLVWKVN
jgi:glyoxylase-like metal-dependent hydrolase (beta-lactamase superfamily II)